MTLLVALIFATWFLVFCELLLPGGILGLVALGAGAYAVWHSYQLFGALVASLLGLGLFLSNLYLIIWGLKYWSKSSLGKGFMLKTSLSAGSASSQHDLTLLGHRGESMTAIESEWKSIDCKPNL